MSRYHIRYEGGPIEWTVDLRVRVDVDRVAMAMATTYHNIIRERVGGDEARTHVRNEICGGKLLKS